MSMNSFGHIFRVTTWGESHGPALGATVDGCPPGVPLEAEMIQVWLDKRRPGQNKHTTQRNEPDQVRILSGVYEGKTTGTPIQLMIENTDQRSKDYGDIEKTFRPGHADITYHLKYGIRDPRGGGRSSARETAARVAAGGVAREVLKALAPGLAIKGYMTQIGTRLTATHSGCPMAPLSPNGKLTSPCCAPRKTTPLGPRLKWLCAAPLRDLARRFMRNSTPIWPRR